MARALGRAAMRGLEILGTVALLAALSRPALAEPRWLACKYTDARGTAQAFNMVFDDLRSTASVFDGVALVEGTNTSVTFQALRTRFPTIVITYNRNDGALAVTPLEGGYGGILKGECRRSPPPPGAPNPP
jgi:hypothetical protein